MNVIKSKRSLEGQRQLIANQLPRLAEKGGHRNVLLSPEQSYPNPHFKTKSFRDEITVDRQFAVSLFAGSLFTVSLSRSVDLARSLRYLLDNEAFKELSSLISVSFTHKKTSFTRIPPQ